MKEMFTQPEVTVIRFSTPDIIVASNCGISQLPNGTDIVPTGWDG